MQNSGHNEASVIGNYPQAKEDQAANGSRLPVSRWFPAGTIKHGGFRVHEGQTGVGRARLLQREARLSDPGNFFLRKNDAWVRVHPRMSFFFFFFQSSNGFRDIAQQIHQKHGAFQEILGHFIKINKIALGKEKPDVGINRHYSE